MSTILDSPALKKLTADAFVHQVSQTIILSSFSQLEIYPFSQTERTTSKSKPRPHSSLCAFNESEDLQICSVFGEYINYEKSILKEKIIQCLSAHPELKIALDRLGIKKVISRIK